MNAVSSVILIELKENFIKKKDSPFVCAIEWWSTRLNPLWDESHHDIDRNLNEKERFDSEVVIELLLLSDETSSVCVQSTKASNSKNLIVLGLWNGDVFIFISRLKVTLIRKSYLTELKEKSNSSNQDVVHCFRTKKTHQICWNSH